MRALTMTSRRLQRRDWRANLRKYYQEFSTGFSSGARAGARGLDDVFGDAELARSCAVLQPLDEETDARAVPEHQFDAIGPFRAEHEDERRRALAWLADVLSRIAAHPAYRLNELLPWNWRPPAQRASTLAA